MTTDKGFIEKVFGVGKKEYLNETVGVCRTPTEVVESGDRFLDGVKEYSDPCCIHVVCIDTMGSMARARPWYLLDEFKELMAELGQEVGE